MRTMRNPKWRFHRMPCSESRRTRPPSRRSWHELGRNSHTGGRASSELGFRRVLMGQRRLLQDVNVVVSGQLPDFFHVED
jgi:hypothetical protein